MLEIGRNRFCGIIETHEVFTNSLHGAARRLSFFLLSMRRNVSKRISKTISRLRTASLASRHEIAIKYSERASQVLMRTSERIVIPPGSYTLGQLLCSLYKRGDRWADELDDSRLLCLVNGREVMLFDTIAPGVELRFSSRGQFF